jgi:hypothetical protein
MTRAERADHLETLAFLARMVCIASRTDDISRMFVLLSVETQLDQAA